MRGSGISCWNAPRKVLIIFLVSVTCIALGCVSHIRRLREAQSQFNMAASLENRIKLGADPQTAIVNIGEAEASYRLATKILTDLLKNSHGELRKDKLLGTAYTLKALAEWRLGNYREAMATATIALDTTGINIYPRDLALLRALRGLIKNDQAFYHMSMKDYAYLDIKRLLRGSIKDLDDALSVSPAGSKLRLYIIMSKLAVLKNWADLRGEPKVFATSVPKDFDKRVEIEQWCGEAQSSWNLFVEELGKLPSGEASGLTQIWEKRLGLPQACK